MRVVLTVTVLLLAHLETPSLGLELLRLEQAKPISRIALGSCAHQDRPQPIWERIADARPDLFLFLGDNIYADTKDMVVMKRKYAKLAAYDGFQRLTRTCPILATWDDHDYGVGCNKFVLKKSVY